MGSNQKYTCELSINNPLGFHVRPVQRFAEFAQVFQSDIHVEIDGREVNGKSVMGLMSLGGRCGAKMKVTSCGEDARQARDVLRYLVREDFFVEDELDPEENPRRHIERLKELSSFFESRIKLLFDGEELDLEYDKDFDLLDFSPTTDVEFSAEGEDAEQASKMLQLLVKYKFYVEDAMNVASD